MPEYEYAVFHHLNAIKPRLGPMTEQAAHEWIESWIEDGGKPNAFFIMRREIGDWAVPEGE